jgi:hypothetical protein
MLGTCYAYIEVLPNGVGLVAVCLVHCQIFIERFGAYCPISIHNGGGIAHEVNIHGIIC